MQEHEMETRTFSLFFLVILAYVNADLVNVAVGKTTTQSGEIWPSKNAVDGIKYCPVINESYYTLTNNSHLPSWQVDLGDLYSIEQIYVYGRRDGNERQLCGFRLFLASADNFTNQSRPVYTNTAADYNNGNIIITSIPPGFYQYVKLDLPDTYRDLYFSNTTKQTGPLVLCEVEVLFYECPNGTFGENCKLSCHCLDEAPCRKMDGFCKSGCAIGWTGPNCSKVCDLHTFGDACNKTCHCIGGSPCVHTNGTCIKGKCDIGWLLPTCSEDGNLIANIKEQVRTYMSSDANNFTSALAIDGHLGPDPDKCHCCSVTSNSLSSWWKLDPGKRYPLKSVVIYGRDREFSYQQLAGFELFLMNSSTDNVSAVALNNQTKYWASDNKYEIPLHNTLTRYVKIQRLGVLTLCEVVVQQGDCRLGTFGEECSQSCHCADNKPCDNRHGYCKSPICRIGWLGKACNTSCPANTFGEGCSNICNCEDGMCTSDYGVCLDGDSPPGVTSINQYVVIGGLVGGAAVVCLILVTIVVFILKFRIQPNRADRKNECTNQNRSVTPLDESAYDTIDHSQDNFSSTGNGGYVNESLTGM